MHERIERKPRGEVGLPVVVVAKYICANEECAATWRILPAFLARHLWRVWRTVERVVVADPLRSRAAAPLIPDRTERRWQARMASAAIVVVTLLAASNVEALEAVARRTGLDATRAELVAAHTQQTGAKTGVRLAPLAAATHMLERGIRLM
jgi:hypothetical protein